MKINRERLGNAFDGIVRFVSITVFFGLFVAPYIVTLLAKNTTRDAQLFYAATTAIILTLLLYGSILIAKSACAAWRRRRVKVVTILEEATSGAGETMHFALAINKAIERLVVACANREYSSFTSNTQQIFGFQLYKNARKTMQLRFHGHPKTISVIKAAIVARLAKEDMEFVRPTEWLEPA